MSRSEVNGLKNGRTTDSKRHAARSGAATSENQLFSRAFGRKARHPIGGSIRKSRRHRKNVIPGNKAQRQQRERTHTPFANRE
jgi:hypothetical protein